MITKPKYGWTHFQVGNFNGNPSYLTDVPMDLLDCFVDYYYKGCGSAWFDEEGSSFTFVLTPYNIYIIEEKDEAILKEYFDIDVIELTKELVNDIENNLEDWVYWAHNHEETDEKYLKEVVQYKKQLLSKTTILKDKVKEHEK